MRGMLIIAAISMTIGAAEGQCNEIYGDWILDDSVRSEGYSEAFTSNNAGSKIGFYCFAETEKCIYYLYPVNTTCESGKRQVLLMSSDSGGSAVETRCFHLREKNFLVFTNFDLITNAYSISNSVGFAAAMEDGGFKSFTFSLKGSNQAISKAASRVINAAKGRQIGEDRAF